MILNYTFLYFPSCNSVLEVPALQNMITSALYTWGMHLSKSQLQVPRGTATQIFVVFLAIYSFILITAYGCNLTAYLTVTRPHTGMETFRELNASQHEVLGMGYFFKISLVSSGNTYLKDLSARYHGLSNFQDSYQPLLSGKGVFIESRKYLEYLIGTKFTEKGEPNMRIMKECYAPYSIAVALQKHSPLKRNFDKVIARIFESGLVRRWFLDTLRINKMVTGMVIIPSDLIEIV
ncbi:hypothetical protein SK128_027036 [Halocaridina rubra]|uniref:Ionotropic glutamate receptor C-terminal domain-containing protein n=1 Tax=Halocaridina rubra TaxID=373956 RepID=A0AAN9AEX8_HALRR